jgi:predicted RNA-binding Zn ribbon-like protein
VPEPEIDFVHPALDLVNSQHGQRPDLLDHEHWFRGFLAHWGYRRAGAPTPSQRARLVELRNLMRRVVEALDEGRAPAPADLRQLNGVLAATPLSRTLVTTGADFALHLVPARLDWTWVLSQLAASMAELLAGGQLERIKVCDNPDCRFAFYDASKNRSRRWCAHTTCGNQHKVRQFRARQQHTR